jgi:hypothetical protein
VIFVKTSKEEPHLLVTVLTDIMIQEEPDVTLVMLNVPLVNTILV